MSEGHNKETTEKYGKIGQSKSDGYVDYQRNEYYVKQPKNASKRSWAVHNECNVKEYNSHKKGEIEKRAKKVNNECNVKEHNSNKKRKTNFSSIDDNCNRAKFHQNVQNMSDQYIEFEANENVTQKKGGVCKQKKREIAKLCLTKMRKKYHDKSVPNDNRKKQNKNRLSKCDISSSDSIRKVLKCFMNSSLRTKRKLLEKIQRWRKYRKTSHFTTHLEQCTMKFNKNTAQGPIYVCTVCLQMWFHISVYCISTIRWKTDNAKKIFQECTQEYTSVRGKHWICKTCKTSLQRGFWPKLSVVNGLGFPPQPEELKLLGMKEHVVSPRMLFFQMRSHHLGGRVQVTGNVVNVALDVAPTVNYCQDHLMISKLCQ